MSDRVVNCEVLIRSTVDAAWDYVADKYFDHHMRWDKAVTDMRQLTAEPIGRGTRGVEPRRFIPGQDAEFEVVKYEPVARFAFRNTSGPFAVDRAYAFTPAPAGTHLTFRFEMAPKRPMTLLFPVLRHVIARQVRANIARIPALVEASARTARQ